MATKTAPKRGPKAPVATQSKTRVAKTVKPAPKAVKPTAKAVKPAAKAKRVVKPSETARRSATVKKPVKKQEVHAKMTASEKKVFRSLLLEMRAQFTAQIQALRGDALTRDDSVNSEEDGTDAFDRQFALSIARSENESVIEIDEALRRLDGGVYGLCEGCECLINHDRLEALPFTRMCIECKSAQENGGGHSSKVRGLAGLG